MSSFLSTQVSVTLGFIITIQDDYNNNWLFTKPVIDLSLMLDKIYKARKGIAQLKNDLEDTLDFASKVFLIGFRSIAFGLGVTS